MPADKPTGSIDPNAVHVSPSRLQPSVGARLSKFAAPGGTSSIVRDRGGAGIRVMNARWEISFRGKRQTEGARRVRKISQNSAHMGRYLKQRAQNTYVRSQRALV